MIRPLILALIFSVGLWAPSAVANNFPGQDVINDFESRIAELGDVQGQDILVDLLETENFERAVEDLTSISNLSIPQAEELLGSIIEIPDLNIPTGGQLLDGFIEERFNVSELTGVLDTLDNLRDRIQDPEILNTLVGNIAADIIPPQLAEAVSLVEELGQLGSIEDFADILATPEIAEQLQEIFDETILENPLAALEAVSALAEVFTNPEELIGLAIDEISEEILGAVAEAVPEVFAGLVELAGGDPAALIGDLGAQLIGNFNLGSFDLAGGASGDYEIFDREPHASPVAQSCRRLCSLVCTCDRPIQQNHINIRAHKTDEFIRHRTWMVDVFFREHIHYAMKLMTVQLSAVAMRQTFVIGKMFDAKHQQETQRLFQQLMAEAHRDYYPSESLCEIGTNTRAIAGSEDKSNIAQLAFTNRMQDRAQRSDHTLSGADENADRVSRILRFQEIYCNRGDNADGLSWLCAPHNTPRERRNKDINFSQTVLSELTLEADYLNEDLADDPDGEDVFALTTNLFSDELMPNMERLRLATPQGLPRQEAMKYMDLRSILAKRSVAENAFASIVAERVSGMDTVDYSFMRRILVDLGVHEDEINEFLGEHPSYYAQRKVLTDYVFENPVFYTELYESHANVLRKDTAIKALNLMLEDDMFDRQLESEAVLAVMLETMLRDEHIRVGRQITDLEPGDY